MVASQPILVAQYSNSRSFDSILRRIRRHRRPVDGDPSMMLVPPRALFAGSYSWGVPIQGFLKNYVNVVADNASLNAITLDGAAISASQFSPIGASGFSGAQLTVGPGSHHLAGSHPFGASILRVRLRGRLLLSRRHLCSRACRHQYAAEPVTREFLAPCWPTGWRHRPAGGCGRDASRRSHRQLSTHRGEPNQRLGANGSKRSGCFPIHRAERRCRLHRRLGAGCRSRFRHQGLAGDRSGQPSAERQRERGQLPQRSPARCSIPRRQCHR